MLVTILSLFVSLVALIFSAELLIKSAEKLARKIGISPLIIGATVVAFGTSLPELIVSITACLEGEPGMGIANIIGSNIANTFFIFGLAVVGGGVRIGTTKTQIKNLVLLCVTILFILGLLLFEKIPQEIGFLWIFLYLCFFIWSFVAGIQGREEEDKTWFQYSIKLSKNENILGIFLLPLGIFGLILSGDWFVKQTVLLTQILGISTTFLGLTLVALGTSLPELMTSLVGVLKKEVKLIEGNILGSNIFNLFFVGGIISLITNVSFKSLLIIGFLFFSSLFGFLVILLNKGKVINRIWGIFFIFSYFCFLYLTFMEK